MLDEASRLRDAASALSTLANQHELSLWQVAGGIYTALGKLYSDHTGEQAHLSFLDSMETYRTRLGAQHLVAPALVNFANRMLERDDIANAGLALTQAYDVIAVTGERLYEAELLRTDAKLCIAQGRAGAKTLLERACAVAKRQGAGLWWLRAALMLAEIHARKGQHQDAIRVLDAPLELMHQKRLLEVERAGELKKQMLADS